MQASVILECHDSHSRELKLENALPPIPSEQTWVLLEGQQNFTKTANSFFHLIFVLRHKIQFPLSHWRIKMQIGFICCLYFFDSGLGILFFFF